MIRTAFQPMRNGVQSVWIVENIMDVNAYNTIEDEGANAKYSALLSIIDTNVDPGYIVDPKTYEFIYANRALVETFGEPERRKCYEHLQHRKEPCPYCTNDNIFGENFGKTFVWEFQNEVNHRWYRCLDRAITWPDGRIVRYEMAVDITDTKQAKAALAEQVDFNQRVFNSTDAHLAVVGREGTILNVNEAWRHFAEGNKGATESWGIGANYFVKYSEVWGDTTLAQEAFEGVRKVQLGQLPTFSLEYPCHGPNNRKCWFVLQVLPIQGNEGIVLVYHTDITKRKLAEAELRESENRFRCMADSAPVLIWMSGPDKLCTYFNKQWLDFTGRTLEHEQGNGWANGVHPDDYQSCLDKYIAAFQTRSTFTMEYRLRRADGEFRWLLDNGVPRYATDGIFGGYIGSCYDITERKWAEEELRKRQRQLSNMAVELSLAEERERRRIASELHDQIGQTLLLGKIKLVSLSKAISKADTVKSFDEIRLLFDQAIQEIRSLTRQLSPPMLKGAGLKAALVWLGQKMEEDYGLHVEISGNQGPTALAEESNSIIFMVCKELLINVAKHANTEKARVNLASGGGTLRLTVEDQGLGFDPEESSDNGSSAKGFGLVSIRERIRFLKGEITIKSSPGHGTRITIQIPLL